MTQFETFAAEYRMQLKTAVRDFPDEYRLTVPVDQVADKMIAAFQAGTYSKDGRAIKATCKTLGIKMTYTEINAYLKG